MKYMKVIAAQARQSGGHAFRQFYVPVDDSGGMPVPCGPMREETSRLSQGDIAVAASEYEGDDGGDPIPKGYQAPDGWRIVAVLPLPDNYVPASAEVREEGQRRAAEYLKEMLRDD